jgi:hypothetical protein
MGNKAVTAFKEAEVERDESIDAKVSANPSFISTKAMTLTGRSGKEWGSVEYMDTSNGDEVLFKSTYKTTSLGKQDVFFADGKTGDNFLTAKCSQNITKSNTIDVYRSTPAYEGQVAIEGGNFLFAEIIIASGITESKSSCKIIQGADIKTEMYWTEKVNAFKFFSTLRTKSKLIGKVYEGPFASNTMFVEVAEGVDMVLAAIMGTSVQAGGSSAGALAGAGVT